MKIKWKEDSNVQDEDGGKMRVTKEGKMRRFGERK